MQRWKINTSKEVRSELEQRGGLKGGLSLITLRHLDTLRSNTPLTEIMTKHQQAGESEPFAISISSRLFPGKIVIVTYEEAKVTGFFQEVDNGNHTH